MAIAKRSKKGIASSKQQYARHHAEGRQKFIAYNPNFNDTQEDELRKHRALSKAIRKRQIRQESQIAEQKRLKRLQPPELTPLGSADIKRLAQIEEKLGYKFQSPRVLYVATYCKANEIPTGPFKLADTNNMYSNMEELATLGDALIALVVLDICQFSHYRRRVWDQVKRDAVSNEWLANLGRNMGLENLLIRERNKNAPLSEHAMGDVVEALMAAVYRDCGGQNDILKGVFRKIGAATEVDRIFLSASELESVEKGEEGEERDGDAAEEIESVEEDVKEGLAQEAVTERADDIADASGSEEGELLEWHGEGTSFEEPLVLD